MIQHALRVSRSTQNRFPISQGGSGIAVCAASRGLHSAAANTAIAGDGEKWRRARGTADPVEMRAFRGRTRFQQVVRAISRAEELANVDSRRSARRDEKRTHRLKQVSSRSLRSGKQFANFDLFGWHRISPGLKRIPANSAANLENFTPPLAGKLDAGARNSPPKTWRLRRQIISAIEFQLGSSVKGGAIKVERKKDVVFYQREPRNPITPTPLHFYDWIIA